MKKNVFGQVLLVTFILLMGAGCRSSAVLRHPSPGSTSAKGLPPGQAKKIYGHQSARAFAPGQQKKNGIQVSSPHPGNSKYKKGKKKK